MPIEITGLEEIIRKLESLDDPNVFRPPMQRSVDHFQQRLARPVPKAPGAFTRLATPGQRRAYWAKVGDDPSLHGPGGYQRQNILAKAWTTKVSANGREGTIGNIKDPPARYVFGARNQQPFHAASGWPRVDKVAEKEQPRIVAFFKAALDKAVKR